MCRTCFRRDIRQEPNDWSVESPRWTLPTSAKLAFAHFRCLLSGGQSVLPDRSESSSSSSVDLESDIDGDDEYETSSVFSDEELIGAKSPSSDNTESQSSSKRPFFYLGGDSESESDAIPSSSGVSSLPSYSAENRKSVNDKEPDIRHQISDCLTRIRSRGTVGSFDAGLYRLERLVEKSSKEVLPSKNAKGLMTSKDAQTITDVCAGDELAEVEIISIVQDQIPKYKLRADTLSTFAGYDEENWCVRYPALKPGESEPLSPEQAEGALAYFVLCGNRVSQMTRTYNDIEAVTTLLQEKEKDLELAARIGQQLLARNKVLEDKVSNLESEVCTANDQITQLRHDLQMKVDLLQIYTNDVEDSSVESTPTGLRHFNVDVLQRKVESLEHENRDLRNEASQLALDTQSVEDQEKKLVADVIEQLGDAHQNQCQLNDELAKKIEENLRQQEEISQYQTQLSDLQISHKRLTHEYDELTGVLDITRECQNELTTELAGLKDKYTEVLDLLHDTQEQLRKAHKKHGPGSRGSSHYGSLFSSFGGNDSIASELQSINSVNENVLDGSRNVGRVFDTVRSSSRHSDTSTPIRLQVSSSDRKGSPYASLSTSGLHSLDSGADSDASFYTDSDDIYGRARSDLDKLRFPLPYGCRTPDSIMSTGSGRMSNSGDWKLPQKLQIVKPLEGSQTLTQWSRLATPHLGGLLEDRQGVAVKGATHCNLNLDVYSMSDLEEDEEIKGYPGKQFMHTSSVYTFTNSTVLHPDDITNLTSSLQSTQISVLPSVSGVDDVSAPATPSHMSRRGSTSTFSTHIALAKHLKERGASTSDSPCNSTPHSPESNSYKLPGIGDITKKIHYGARLLKKTIYGSSPPKMNLIEKVNAIGVDNLVSQGPLMSFDHVTPVRPGEGQLEKIIANQCK